ncbi:MAG: phosphoribosylformylglycinamidine cyclo-ligase [candidate division KSB1 bacterium]|nr:phosphoribosylformylglycinamidine cyclo-ligase [candidate division KSB1 bacterium]MDZ7341229.1 phosphoribosylformylglycinamidine cyclo-ligase [candidate division KSB1 bacterium]
MPNEITYKAAGVDIDAGDQSVKLISKLARMTFNDNVVKEIGLFGAFYRLSCANLKTPVLVSSVDGVGTKLKIAFMTGVHNTVGEDLVNHCVNDIMTSGAEPLFFLDYVAVSRLTPTLIEQIVAGMARGCQQANCALIGGETAEMPDFYQLGEYDISGTIVGLVEAEEIIDGSSIQKGDVLLGMPSSGLHTNGYSLARKILFERHRFKVDDYFDELGCTLGEELLKVHRSYRLAVLQLKDREFLHGISHITGGGIEGNTRRVLQAGQRLAIDWQSWNPPAIFRLIQKLGHVTEPEMRRVFNLGIGMIFIIAKDAVDEARQLLQAINQPSFVIGEIV